MMKLEKGAGVEYLHGPLGKDRLRCKQDRDDRQPIQRFSSTHMALQSNGIICLRPSNPIENQTLGFYFFLLLESRVEMGGGGEKRIEDF